jgi:hypothetical protein
MDHDISHLPAGRALERSVSLPGKDRSCMGTDLL